MAINGINMLHKHLIMIQWHLQPSISRYTSTGSTHPLHLKTHDPPLYIQVPAPPVIYKMNGAAFNAGHSVCLHSAFPGVCTRGWLQKTMQAKEPLWKPERGVTIRGPV